MYSNKGERTKPTPDKTFQTKDPLTKPPDKNSREQLRENLYRGLLPELFVLGLLKIGEGSEMCDLFWGARDVIKCDRGRGPKLTNNSVTYFMDGPIHIHTHARMHTRTLTRV